MSLLRSSVLLTVITVGCFALFSDKVQDVGVAEERNIPAPPDSTKLPFPHIQPTPEERVDLEQIHHAHYSLGYSESHEMAAWVMYELTPHEANTRAVERKNRFKADPQVSTASLMPDAMKGTGYHRGHLAPARDMLFSEVAMTESFYMSNIAAQQAGFNTGVWKRLEAWVHDLAAAGDTLWVYTGPILSNGMDTIETGVYEADGFFKVIIDPAPAPKAIGFIVPHEKSKQPLASFACPVDSVETLSGLDFLPTQGESLESQIEVTAWPF